jgi:hypothetical protein
MHDHMYYPQPINLDGRRVRGELQFEQQSSFTFPRLYLAAGVTSLRTTASVEPYADLNLKAWIDAGKIPGPKVHVTGHLCSITYREAAELGTDDLEHRFTIATEFNPEKSHPHRHVERSTVSGGQENAHCVRQQAVLHFGILPARLTCSAANDQMDVAQ